MMVVRTKMKMRSMDEVDGGVVLHLEAPTEQAEQEYSPVTHAELTIRNPSALSRFENGAEFYVEISRAD